MLTKQLMAEIRKEDYTHAGEEEAIDIVMNNFLKDTSRELLDVGCGLGGTADYISKHGWGNVSGIDIENELIDYAKNKYKDVKFFQCDALNCNDLFPKEQFDFIYHFNSFYAFSNQEMALQAFYKIAKPNSNLIIFDYLALNNYDNSNPFVNSRSFIPINKNKINMMLNNTGWNLDNFINLTTEYIEWYKIFINKMTARKKELIKQFNETTFNQVYNNFTNLMNLFDSQKLGGCIIYASKLSNQ